jgi:hypothetical protein
MLARVEAAESVRRCLSTLELGAQEPEPGRWRVRLDCAGYPLEVQLGVRGALVRASAAVLPPDVIEPRQLLYWNAQAPLVCFAQSSAGEVLVCGELPARTLDADLLDRFLGLLVASATRAREFVLAG